MAVSLSFVGLVKSSPFTNGGNPAGSGAVDQTNDLLGLVFLGTLPSSGNYTAGGEPLDFTSAAAANYTLPSTAPTICMIEELGVIGTAVPGFKYQYVYSSLTAAPTPQGGAVQIFGSGAGSGQGGTEISGAWGSTTPSLASKQLKIVAYFAKSV